MSAWKLDNPIPAARTNYPLPSIGNQPAAEDTQNDTAEPAEMRNEGHPLPAIGNLWIDSEERRRQCFASLLPERETLFRYFKALRETGEPVPDDELLFEHPEVAFLFYRAAIRQCGELPPLDVDPIPAA